MRSSVRRGTVLTGALALVALAYGYGCSASSGSSGNGLYHGTSSGSGGSSAGSPDASLGTGSSFTGSGSTGSGEGGSPNFGSLGGGSNQEVVDACPAVSQKPETIYIDASYSDTVTEQSPLAIFIMQDRSGSMVTGFPEGDAHSWANSTSALTTFVNDPNSRGLDVGLGFFPPLGGVGACDGSDCGKPAVDIGPIQSTGPQMINAFNQGTPGALNLTPTECGLRGMINECLTYMQSHPGEQCVALLVTDGNPTLCDGNTANLVNIVSDGKSKGVTTFTLGLPGSTLDFLNQLAQAGGTNSAIDATNAQTTQQNFLGALNSIRTTYSKSVTTHVTHSLSTPLSCQWKIPAPPDGVLFDPTLVNLQLTPPNGAPIQYGHVDAESQCSGVVDGWYYDDNTNPTLVTVCPQTCDKVKATQGGRVDILLNCKTIPAAPPQ